MLGHLPLNKEATYLLLEKLDLSEQAWEIFKLSFRTRVMEESDGEMISFQFRILPERISAQQKEKISLVHEELLTRLQKHYPDLLFEVVLQVAFCCGRDCFGCRKKFI